MNRLRELRQEFGYTIRDFDKFNLGRNVITYIENDKTDVNLDKLAIFCKVFQVSADYFCGQCDEGIYVKYLENTYSLARNNFLKYKELGFIKYENNQRLLIIPDEYDINFVYGNIKIIEIKPKKN